MASNDPDRPKPVMVLPSEEDRRRFPRDGYRGWNGLRLSNAGENLSSLLDTYRKGGKQALANKYKQMFPEVEE